MGTHCDNIGVFTAYIMLAECLNTVRMENAVLVFFLYGGVYFFYILNGAEFVVDAHYADKYCIIVYGARKLINIYIAPVVNIQSDNFKASFFKLLKAVGNRGVLYTACYHPPAKPEYPHRGTHNRSSNARATLGVPERKPPNAQVSKHSR